MRTAISAFLVFVLLAGQALAAKHNSYKGALDASKQDSKHVMLVFGAKWCGPCRLLKNELENNPTVKKEVNSYNICYVDIDERPDIAAKYRIGDIPVIVIVNKLEKTIAIKYGYRETDNLSSWLYKNKN